MSMILIQRQVLSSSAASVTFSNIPQNYKTLVLMVSARSTWSPDPGIDLLMRFNSDSGSNYTSRRLTGNGSSAGSDIVTANFAAPGVISAGAGTANTFGSLVVTIPNYANSANKVWSSDAAQENNTTAAVLRLIAGLWSSTAAITHIEVYSNGSGAQLVSGTSCSLYGLL